MKKLWCLPAVLVVSFLLSGCGAVISEEDNRIIAEYAADLLLKYDKNYQEPLIEPETESEADTDTDTSEPAETVSDETASTSTEEDETTEASTAETIREITDIAEVLGLEGFAIEFDQCLFLNQYPSAEEESPLVSLDAEPGHKLVVLEFSISNQTEQDAEIDLLHHSIDYKLVMNDSREAKPMLTILTDDLGTLQSVVPAGSSQKAVLVFQMSEGMIGQIASLKVRVTYEDEECMLRVQ